MHRVDEMKRRIEEKITDDSSAIGALVTQAGKELQQINRTLTEVCNRSIDIETAHQKLGNATRKIFRRLELNERKLTSIREQFEIFILRMNRELHQLETVMRAQVQMHAAGAVGAVAAAAAATLHN